MSVDRPTRRAKNLIASASRRRGDAWREAGKDPIGQQFSDPERAKAHATRIAREIAQDDDWDGYSVVVVDEHGNEIARVPIQD